MECPKCQKPLYRFLTVALNTETGFVDPEHHFPGLRHADYNALWCPACRDNGENEYEFFDYDEKKLKFSDLPTKCYEYEAEAPRVL